MMKWLPQGLTGAGLGLLLLAAVSVFGGIQTSIGPLHISATSASRLVFEAAVLMLLGECLRVAARPRLVRRSAECEGGSGEGGRGMGRPGRLFTVLALFLMAAASDADTRRVGDGFEYLGMARNLARGLPPSLSPGDVGAVTSEMAAHGDRTWDAPPMPPLRGADGRFDFPHFWLCSLVAVCGIATSAGVHPAAGFTMMNLALLLAACWLLLRAGAGLTSVLFAAMMLWWVDKAHAEVFIATVAAAGVLLRADAPVASLLLLGVAAAQMPPLVVLSRHPREKRWSRIERDEPSPWPPRPPWALRRCTRCTTSGGWACPHRFATRCCHICRAHEASSRHCSIPTSASSGLRRSFARSRSRGPWWP